VSTLAAIREGLRSNLSSIPGVNVSAYVLSNPTYPQLWVYGPADERIIYHRAMHDGSEDWNIVVQALVGIPSDIGGQKVLDELVASSGVSSVKAALESDRTLGGAAEDLVVQSCSGYGVYPRPDGTTALGAEWAVLVMMTGQ